MARAVIEQGLLGRSLRSLGISARPRRRPPGRAQGRPAGRRARLAIVFVAVLALLAGGWVWLRDSPLVAVQRVTVTGLGGAQSSQIRAALTVAARGMTTLDVREGDAARRGQFLSRRQGAERLHPVPARAGDRGQRAATRGRGDGRRPPPARGVRRDRAARRPGDGPAAGAHRQGGPGRQHRSGPDGPARAARAGRGAVLRCSPASRASRPTTGTGSWSASARGRPSISEAAIGLTPSGRRRWPSWPRPRTPERATSTSRIPSVPRGRLEQRFEPERERGSTGTSSSASSTSEVGASAPRAVLRAPGRPAPRGRREPARRAPRQRPHRR